MFYLHILMLYMLYKLFYPELSRIHSPTRLNKKQNKSTTVTGTLCQYSCKNVLKVQNGLILRQSKNSLGKGSRGAGFSWFLQAIQVITDLYFATSTQRQSCDNQMQINMLSFLKLDRQGHNQQLPKKKKRLPITYSISTALFGSSSNQYDPQ